MPLDRAGTLGSGVGGEARFVDMGRLRAAAGFVLILALLALSAMVVVEVWSRWAELKGVTSSPEALPFQAEAGFTAWAILLAILGVFSIAASATLATSGGDSRASAPDEHPPEQASVGNQSGSTAATHGNADYGQNPPEESSGGTEDGKFDVVSFLTNHGLEVIDKRSDAGALWVKGGSELYPLFDELRGRGIQFKFARSGWSATQGQPGWRTYEP